MENPGQFRVEINTHAVDDEAWLTWVAENVLLGPDVKPEVEGHSDDRNQSFCLGVGNLAHLAWLKRATKR